MSRRLHDLRGFTLVELLVVIGVIALLISVLLPALAKARASAQAVKCQATHKQIMAAMLIYLNENDGYAPRVSQKVEIGTSNEGDATWYHRQFLGRTLGNKALNNNWNQRNTTLAIYCPTYTIGWEKNTGGNTQWLGIGFNTRYGSRVSRNDGTTGRQVKLTRVKKPAQFITFVDMIPNSSFGGTNWDRYFVGDSGWTSNSPANTSVVAYRHNKRTVVSFADGHVDTFGVNSIDREATYKDQGLHAEYTAGRVTHLPGQPKS